MKVAIAGVIAIVAAVGVFALGRATAADDDGAAPPETSRQVFLGGLGDVFRVPSARMSCIVSGEQGVEDRLICNHVGDRPRYQAVFRRNTTFVHRVGDPGSPPVFVGRETP